MEQKINLLLVEKDLSLCSLIDEALIVDGFNIYFNELEEDILSFITKNSIQAVILDLEKDKPQGLELLRQIKAFDAFVDVILLGRPLTSDEVMDLINQGATGYLPKPVRLEQLQIVLQKIADIRELRRNTYRLQKKLEKKYYFHGIIGKSPEMLEIFSLIEKIANYFSSVLLTGESGTGKELAARAIHKLSPVRNRKLVICDCVSIPETLFESELFGYAKGAFTGADKDKRGLFEEAHEGVIFLDEIGEIPTSIQAKLLRVLEQHQFRPLGSNKVRNVEVKIIAATNRNLREVIEKGTFREDLFHRLNKVEIHLPLLRERPEDIPLLARHFLNHFSKKFNKNLKGASREVQKLFLKYDWPGNVRELENVLERASMLTEKEFIDIQDLPGYLRQSLPSGEGKPDLKREELSTLEEMEKEYILHVLRTTNNNLRQAAKILAVARNTLYNKLRKYRIPH